MTIYEETQDLYKALKEIEGEEHKFTKERVIIGALLAICEELKAIHTELRNQRG